MSGRLLISVCLVASAVLAYPQNGWQNGQQQGANGAANGYGNNGANGNGNNGGRQLQPNEPQNGGGGAMMPMNYDFKYEVDDEESGNYYGHKEAADNGRVDGSYHVWLPDGRLMNVEYYVDGDSGFVPTITFEDAYTPTWGNSYFAKRRR